MCLIVNREFRDREMQLLDDHFIHRFTRIKYDSLNYTRDRRFDIYISRVFGKNEISGNNAKTKKREKEERNSVR